MAKFNGNLPVKKIPPAGETDLGETAKPNIAYGKL
jgi:hypothetical protein